MTLYQNIIETIKFRNIRSPIEKIITEYGAQNVLKQLQDLTESESLGKALWLLGYEQKSSGQLIPFQDNDATDDNQKIIENYFFSQVTNSDLKRLGLTRSINNSQDRFRVLSCILQCLIGLSNTEGIESHRRVILWIDELEDLISYPVRN